MGCSSSAPADLEAMEARVDKRPTAIQEMNAIQMRVDNDLKPREKRVHTDILYRIQLVGPRKSGKTAVMQRFCASIYPPLYTADDDGYIDFRHTDIDVGEDVVRLQVWDTPSRALAVKNTAAFYYAVDGIILVFDVTSKSSFDMVEPWIADIQEKAPRSAITLLVGNKAEGKARAVTVKQAEALAETLGLAYVETSARDDTNIEAVFVAATRNVMRVRPPPSLLQADDDALAAAEDHLPNPTTTTTTRSAAHSVASVGLSDFERLRSLGRGAFGEVSLARRRATGDLYAIKTLSKRMLVAVKQVKGALSEAAVLKMERHPNVVSMHYAFQDEASLHMVLDYMPGGDLFDRLSDEGSTFSLPRAKLYAAEVASALGHLHDTLQIIYRDLKPENILIDAQGHAKLTDFGLVKTAERRASIAGSGGGSGGGGRMRGTSFVGTLEYMAPEVMRQKGGGGSGGSGGAYTKAVDWWGLGVLLHEMLVGKTPFCAESHEAVQTAVLGGSALAFSPTLDRAATALLEKLLRKDPEKRLGWGDTGTADVTSAAFWAPLTFEGVYRREYKPLWTPSEDMLATSADGGEEEEGGADTADTDDMDDEWHMLLSATDPAASAGAFAGFSFVRDEMWQPKNAGAQPTRLVARRKSMEQRERRRSNLADVAEE